MRLCCWRKAKVAVDVRSHMNGPDNHNGHINIIFELTDEAIVFNFDKNYYFKHSTHFIVIVIPVSFIHSYWINIYVYIYIYIYIYIKKIYDLKCFGLMPSLFICAKLLLNFFLYRSVEKSIKRNKLKLNTPNNKYKSYQIC